MAENIDINRFALTAVLTAARAKRPSEYPDFETLNAMSDAALVAYAEGLLYSLRCLVSRVRSIPPAAVCRGCRKAGMAAWLMQMVCKLSHHRGATDGLRARFDLNRDAKVDVHRALPFSSWDWLCEQSGP